MHIWNIEAQKTLLCCFLLDNTLIDMTLVRQEFFASDYENLAKCIFKVRKEWKIVSTMSLVEIVTYPDLLRDISSYCLTTKEFETAQEIVVEDYNKKRIMEICERVAYLAKDENKTSWELATMISDWLILESKEEADNLFPQVIETFDKIFMKQESIYIINTTGFKWLDAYTGWRREGSLYILAARPSIGKSTLMLNFMLRAIEQSIWCCIMSTEMPTKEIHIRSLSNIWWIESWKIENWLENIQQQLADSTVKFMNDTLWYCSIYDQFYFEDIERIVSKEAMLWRKIIFLDYLQQVPTQKPYFNKNNYIESITNKLKKLAIKYWLAIICLSQLKRTNAEPELTDLRDSGAIEQDADVVMFLHNDDEYTNTIDILVKKNRHRDKGATQITFNKKCFRMF